jgi:exodeoxyribonuclease VII large subunit
VLSRARQDLDRGSLALHARGERVIAQSWAQLHALHHRLAGLHPRARILAHKAVLGELERRLLAVHPGRRIVRGAHEIETLIARRDAAMHDMLDERRGELGRLGAQMAALSPLAVLDRGYAMVQKDGAIVRDASQVRAHDRLRVRLAKGTLDVAVEGTDDDAR